MSSAFKKTFVSPKIPVVSKKLADPGSGTGAQPQPRMCLLLNFVVDGSGDLVVQGSDIMNDEFYRTAPILPEDWRSFGFGPLKTLKAKHKALLYKRIVSGLGFNFEIGELYLTWVWVVEARVAREKKEREERKGAMAVQGIVRMRLAWLRVDEMRRQMRGAIAMQCMHRRVTAVKRTAEVRARVKSSVVIQKVARARKATLFVKEEREKKRAAVQLQSVVRGRQKRVGFEVFRAETLAARFLQKITRGRIAVKRVVKIRAEERERARIAAEEKERQVRLKKERDEQAKKDAILLAQREKVLAHQAWERKKKKKAIERRKKKELEEIQKAKAEEEKKRTRQQNIILMQKRIKKRSVEKRRRIRRKLKELEKAKGSDNQQDLASQILPRLALAVGVEIDMTNHYKAVKRSIKSMNKRGALPKIKGSPPPRSSLAFIDIKNTRKKLHQDMRIVVAKKRRKKKKDDNPVTDIEEEREGVGGYEKSKFFLSKKEKRDLNFIDMSPVKASMSDLL
ncbi:hypothetical protein TrST_g7491 [Triparma strigata]|uniref:Uncharacterized protein n=1 Tax=Triparma strigata TaxID=1606541 RepID=A0A9W7E5G6_9STRA|nr:hypothetical protein TrST_g7491 [Triparma strigata]